MTDRTWAIQTEDLAKRYGKLTALAGLTMSVPRGEVFGFLGPNGAGKTTAVKLLLGLTRATSGEGRVLGRPLGDRRARQRIGYLPELFRYPGWLSAREALAFHCELAGLPRDSWAAAIEHALQIVGLAARGDDRVETYSKGMQQRLGLGIALLGQPDLVFLDEPTSALDPVGRHDVREVTRTLRERGTTVFLNSHLLSEVEQVCDRVAVVHQGKVIALGRLPDLLSATASVRLRVSGVRLAADPDLAGWGAVADDGEWQSVHGIAVERIPDLVAAIVRKGGRVYAVEPCQQTLEERFLQLLQHPTADRTPTGSVFGEPVTPSGVGGGA